MWPDFTSIPGASLLAGNAIFAVVVADSLAHVVLGVPTCVAQRCGTQFYFWRLLQTRLPLMLALPHVTRTSIGTAFFQATRADATTHTHTLETVNPVVDEVTVHDSPRC